EGCAILAALADDADREAILADAVRRAHQLDPYRRIDALVEMAPHLSTSLLAEVLAQLTSMSGEELRAIALRRFAPSLAPSPPAPCAPLLASIRNPAHRRTTMARLSPLLPLPLPDAVLRSVRSIADDAERALLLRTVALRLTGPEQEQVLKE